MADDQVSEVRVAIVFSSAVVPVIRRRCQAVQPVPDVLVQSGLIIIDEHPGGDMHGADQHHAFLDAAVFENRRSLVGKPHKLTALGRVERDVVRM